MAKASSVQQFIEAINASPELTKAAQKALDGSDDPKKFVALASKHGYKISQRDVRKYFKEVVQAPSSEAVSERQLKAVVGAKVDAEIPTSDDHLKHAVTMLRSMSFRKTPNWTGFGFVRPIRSIGKRGSR